MENKHQEENELLEIWNLALEYFPDCRACFSRRRLKYIRKKKPNHICFEKRSLFWQLKAKMDKDAKLIEDLRESLVAHLQLIEILKNLNKDQRKQILGFAKDNMLLYQRLKKCQELNQPKTITNKEFKKRLEQFEG